MRVALVTDAGAVPATRGGVLAGAAGLAEGADLSRAARRDSASALKVPFGYWLR
jgi:hypothetical protein